MVAKRRVVTASHKIYYQYICLYNYTWCILQSLPLLKFELLLFQVFCAGLLVIYQLILWQIKTTRVLCLTLRVWNQWASQYPRGFCVLLKDTWTGRIQGSGIQPPTQLRSGKTGALCDRDVQIHCLPRKKKVLSKQTSRCLLLVNYRRLQ